MPFPLPHPLPRIPVPQHPNVVIPCLFCGKHDGRTAAGAVRCHECTELAEQDQAA